MFFQLIDPLRYFRNAISQTYSPHQIAWGIALGMLVGLTPKGNLTAWIFGFALFASRVNIGAGMLTAIAVSAVAGFLDPLTHGIGLRLLNTAAIQEFLKGWHDRPIVAWLALNNTVVLGSATLGLVLAYPTKHIGHYVITHVGPRIRAFRPNKQQSNKQSEHNSFENAISDGSRMSKVTDFMPRWSYIVPRAGILTLCAIAAWIALNPVLRWSLIHGGQAVTGAAVEVDRVRSLLSKAEVQLTHLAIADPQSPMTNLLEANRVIMDVDMGQLLRRRLVVNEGHLGGIQLGTARVSSGEIVPKHQDSNGPDFAEKATALGEKWLEDAADKLSHEFDTELKSVALARELMQRWPEEYGRLEDEAKAIRDRGRVLIDAIQQTKKNPIQSVEHYRQLLADMDALRRDGFSVRGRFQQLQRQIQLDRDAIDQAKQHDAQYVQQRMQLAKLDPEAVSNYLLGPEMAPQVNDLVRWLQWGRQQLPAKEEAPRLPVRGWDVLLPGMKTNPSLLVRKLTVDGGGFSDGQPFAFVGTIEGLTPQPSAYGKPAILKVQTSGSVGMMIQAVLDHTADLAQDQILIECPDFAHAARTLGDEDKLAVHVGPGKGNLSIKFDLSGDDLDGVIQFQQPSVKLSADVGDKLGGAYVAEHLSTATSAIDHLRATVRLAGNLQKPSWKLQSNLGSQLASGLQNVMSQEIQRRKQQLMATVNQEVDTQLTKVHQEILVKQDELIKKLDLDTQQMDFIKTEIAQLGLGDKLLGEKGLLKSIFR